MMDNTAKSSAPSDEAKGAHAAAASEGGRNGIGKGQLVTHSAPLVYGTVSRPAQRGFTSLPVLGAHADTTLRSKGAIASISVDTITPVSAEDVLYSLAPTDAALPTELEDIQDDAGIGFGMEGTDAEVVALMDADDCQVAPEVEEEYVPLPVEAQEDTPLAREPVSFTTKTVTTSPGLPDVTPPPSVAGSGTDEEAAVKNLSEEERKHRAAILACMGPFTHIPVGRSFKDLQLLTKEEQLEMSIIHGLRKTNAFRKARQDSRTKPTMK